MKILNEEENAIVRLPFLKEDMLFKLNQFPTHEINSSSYYEIGITMNSLKQDLDLYIDLLGRLTK